MCFKLRKAPSSSALVEETDDVLHSTKHASTVCEWSAAMIQAAAATFFAWWCVPSLPILRLDAWFILPFEMIKPGGSNGSCTEVGGWKGL